MKVSLGGFELKDFEKPDFIQLGGKQMLAIREFPGGSMSIQDFGPTYRPINWSGTFTGTDAYDRMMTIGLMRTAGKPVQLTTEKFTIPVMIEEFLPDYKTARRIPFSITVRRVVDNKSNQTQVVDVVDKSTTMVADSSTTASSQEYIVKSGDTLSRIAANLLGDPNKWEQIYQDNQGALVNGPHKIQPGMKLVINIA